MAKVNANAVHVTQEGKLKLEEELYHLIHVVRQEVAEELQAARAQGDLSENADYDAARDHQARVEARIAELDEMLKNVEIIEFESGKGSARVVRLGSTVTVLDNTTNEEATYTIVGSVEADPFNGKISNVCKLAKCIMEHKVGDKVTIEVEEPYTVDIVDIK